MCEYFSFKNIQHLRKAFCVKLLGTGGFATVSLYQCKEIHDDKLCNKLFVIKNIRHDVIPSYFNRQQIAERYNFIANVMKNEYKFSSKMDHPFLVRALDMDVYSYSIVYEYFKGMDMIDYLNMFGCTDGKFLMQVYKQLLETVGYLHDMGVAHMDIKLENILIETDEENNPKKTDFVLKLIDFGSAKQVTPEMRINNVCGTLCYFPPEMCSGYYYYPQKVDVWCCGIVLYNFIYDRMPWEEAKGSDPIFVHVYKELTKNMLHPDVFPVNKFFKFDDIDLSILHDCFLKMFHLDENKRPTIHQIKACIEKLNILKDIPMPIM